MIIGKEVEVDFREKYTGTLIHFGIGYEELRDGIGHYTEAIVMTKDGQLHSCPANCVRVLGGQNRESSEISAIKIFSQS